MKVETYEVEEINSSEAATMAADAASIEIIEKLGLKGQQKLTNVETGTRHPYRKMTSLEQIVFGLHCPHNTELSEYDSGPIPLRVLQVAAYCKENEFYPRIEIWHPQDAKLDPVLVGRSMPESWRGELFLLARWGEVWKDFAQLAIEAKAIWLAQRKAQFAKMRSELAGDESALEQIADEVFATGKMQTVNYSGW